MKNILLATTTFIFCLFLISPFSETAIGQQEIPINSDTLAYDGSMKPKQEEELYNNQLQWIDPFPLEMTSSFYHKEGEEISYTSHITGLLNVTLSEAANNGLEVEFRTGIGRYVKSLGLYFDPKDQNKILSTGSIPCLIAAPNVTEKGINDWLMLKTKENPALKINLTPALSNVQVDVKTDTATISPFYTNPEAINGEIFVLDTSGKKPYYRYYSKISIPPFKFHLNRVLDNMGEQEVTIHLDDVSVTDISDEIWQMILSDGNQHLQLPESPTPGHNGEVNAGPYELSGGADRVSSLVSSLESMYIASVITSDEAGSLLEEINDILKNDNRRDMKEYVFSLVSFERTLEAMSNSIDAAVVEHISTLSNYALTSFLDGDLPDSPDYTPSDPGERVDWYIDSDSISPSPDGSMGNPFSSILAALEAAELASIPGLNLHVYGGVYREALQITRDTIITEIPGELAIITGSITNDTPALLSISSFHLLGSRGLGAVNVFVFRINRKNLAVEPERKKVV